MCMVDHKVWVWFEVHCFYDTACFNYIFVVDVVENDAVDNDIIEMVIVQRTTMLSK